jgi:hypothetical protein
MPFLEIKSRNKYWKRVDGTPIVRHFPSGEKVYVLLIHLGFFDFQKAHFGTPVRNQTLFEGQIA